MGDTAASSPRQQSPASRSESKSSQNDALPSVESTSPRSNTSSPLLGAACELPPDGATICPYCHKDYRKPRVLDCLHSMCEDCIIAQLDGRRENGIHKPPPQPEPESTGFDVELEMSAAKVRPTPPGVIRCPTCMQESHVGNDVRYVHSMLMDFVRLTEADTHRGIERKCRACKSEQAAVAVCQHCVADLCPTCLEAHKNMRMFDGHQVLLFEELESSGRTREARIVLCTAHAQPYIMLCTTCEVLVCSVCLESDHRNNHKLIEVSERVSRVIQNELSKLATKVKEKWADSMNRWATGTDKHASLEQQFEVARARIDMVYETIQQLLEETRNRKLKELESERNRMDDELYDLERKVDVTQSRVADAVGFAERLVNQANGMELLTSRRKVIQQLTNLEHTLPSINSEYELDFVPPEKKAMETQLSSAYGTITCRNVSSYLEKQRPAKETMSAEAIMERAREAWNDISATEVQRPLMEESFKAPPHVVEKPVGPGIIGMERRKTATAMIPPIARPDYLNGWNHTNAPDLPSPSPPTDPIKTPIVAPGANTPTGIQPIGTPTSNIYNNMQWNQNPAAQFNANGAASTTAATNAAALLLNAVNNPALFQNPGALSLNSAQLQQMHLKAALMYQQNSLVGGAMPNLQNHLLLQQRLRGLNSQLDIVGQLNQLGALGLDGGLTGSQGIGRAPGLDGLISTPSAPRKDYQNSGNELKMHSVFGAGVAGNSLRELNTPGGFSLADNDDILIADTNNHRIIVCGPPHPWFFGKAGQEDGCLCYPRKVVALKLKEHLRYIVLDKSPDTKSRCQVFTTKGEFLHRVDLCKAANLKCLDVQAACGTLAGHLVLVDHGGIVYSLDISTNNPRVIHWFDTAPRMGEATDVAMYDHNVYITDFRNHCVHVFSVEGTYLRKLGEPAITPYPIGIDISKSGDVLVADTHGNHMHIVVFAADDIAGRNPQSFTHQEFKMSRCTQLRVSASGHIVCLSKQAHTLFVFKPLFVR
ncbi:unnamed protein product, partial [Mesorhabditis spiculigera]